MGVVGEDLEELKGIFEEKFLGGAKKSRRFRACSRG